MSEPKKGRWKWILMGLFYGFSGLLFLLLGVVAKRQGVIQGPKGSVMDAGQCHAVAVLLLAGGLYCFYQTIRAKP